MAQPTNEQCQLELPYDRECSDHGPMVERFWGNAKLPTPAEMAVISEFGSYPDFDSGGGTLSGRLGLEVANLRQATRIIVYHHYLHRGRTMAQLPYWITIDDRRVGVMLYAYPRLSVPIQGIRPMNLLELARLWVHPSVQGHRIVGRDGKEHALSVPSCAIGQSLRRLRSDWRTKYPQLPDVQAVVSWADDVHHEGTVYKASNFEQIGKSGGAMHGNRRRDNGGEDKLNPDYSHVKTMYLFQFRTSEPSEALGELGGNAAHASDQLRLFDA